MDSTRTTNHRAPLPALWESSDAGRREVLADARDLWAAAREHIGDERERVRRAREARGEARDGVRAVRDVTADERDRVSDEREAIGRACDEVRALRDSTADERDMIADARDQDSEGRERVVAELLASASHRDSMANRRDALANRRDMEANLAALVSDTVDESAFTARGFAQQDRLDSRVDRTASADDRLVLSTTTGSLSLPVSIRVEPDVWKLLKDCTVAEVSDYSSVLLQMSLGETDDVIGMVEHDGVASARAKELLQVSRAHHEDADDLVWYVGEWFRTGDQPVPAGV
jgi:hypothetical protein